MTEAPERSRRGTKRRPLVIGVAVVVALLIAGGATALAASGSGDGGYRMGKAVDASVSSNLVVVGTIEPVNDASASFQVAGQVATVTVVPGAQVTAGETLATLDTTSLSESVSSAELSLQSDDAKLTEDEDSETAGDGDDDDDDDAQVLHVDGWHGAGGSGSSRNGLDQPRSSHTGRRPSHVVVRPAKGGGGPGAGTDSACGVSPTSPDADPADLDDDHHDHHDLPHALRGPLRVRLRSSRSRPINSRCPQISGRLLPMRSALAKAITQEESSVRFGHHGLGGHRYLGKRRDEREG